VADADAAVELANGSAFGLGGAVFSSDEQLAMDVADRLDVGMVWINTAELGGPELPFGGTKRSGVGRELGPLGIDEFVNKKLIHTPPSAE
jgi:succinate-semialdehyde dehydrogenase/glutarate-semialdehyde dehydrogenase